MRASHLHISNIPQQLHLVCRLKGHTNTVTVAEGVYVPGESGDVNDNCRTLIASASVDSTVRIWERKQAGGTAILSHYN